jgi:hypothetical protein
MKEARQGEEQERYKDVLAITSRTLLSVMCSMDWWTLFSSGLLPFCSQSFPSAQFKCLPRVWYKDYGCIR